MPVTAMDLRRQQANNSPTISRDPGEPRFVVLASRIDGPDFSCALHVSGDGGRSWLPVNPVTRLPEGVEKCYAPEVDFDSSGRLYYLFIGLAGRGNSPVGTYLTTSADRARSFTPPRKVLGARRYMVRMAIDRSARGPGRLHLVWVQARSDPPLGGFGPPPNPVMSAYSNNSGKTFSRPVQISDPGRKLVAAPALALGPGGTVHVVYYDLGEDLRDYYGLQGPPWEGKWALVSTISRDGGRSFDSGVAVDEQIAPPERVLLIFTMPAPGLAVTASGDAYAAWTDQRNGDSDVLAASSRNGGRWKPIGRVNDDGPGNGRSQYMPRLASGSRSRIHVIFYDRRNDSKNLLNDVYYSQLTGGHLGPNIKLTSKPFSSQIGQPYQLPSMTGLIEFGSRLGLLSNGSSVVAAWTDTRNSPGGIGQDIFSRRFQLARPKAVTVR